MVLDPRPEPATTCLIKHTPLASSVPERSADTAPARDPVAAPEPMSPGEEPVTDQEASPPHEEPVAPHEPLPPDEEPVAAEDPSPPCEQSAATKDTSSSNEEPVATKYQPAHNEAQVASAQEEEEDEGDLAHQPGVSFIPPSSPEPEEAPDGLEEVSVSVGTATECMHLRKPDDVYRDIYRAARRKAKQMRKAAVAALLEAQQIRARYMLEDVGESDDDFDKQEVADEPGHSGST